MELTEHQIFLCETTDQAAAMGNGEIVRLFFLDRDRTPLEKAEIAALGLRYVGVFGCRDGVPECKLASDVDLRLAIRAGAEYGHMLAKNISVTWLQNLHRLIARPVYRPGTGGD